jgi:hypothetical protein
LGRLSAGYGHDREQIEMRLRRQGSAGSLPASQLSVDVFDVQTWAGVKVEVGDLVV